MPQRTNEFQELVALIERSLAPRGAKITESAMVPTDDDPREIDVLIESMNGAYTMKVAVEAKDESRPMDITKFESIIAKYSGHSGLRVNQVVVVARAGFSKKVKVRARKENIVLLTLEKAFVEDWATKVPQKIRLSIAPHIARFEFVPELPTAKQQVLIETGRLICECCGRDHGNPLQIAQEIIRNSALMDQARARSSRANAPKCLPVAREFGHKVFLSTENERFSVTRLIVHIHCTEARGELNVEAYKRDEQLVHHLHGSVGGTDIQFVLPDGLTSSQIALKVQANAQSTISSNGLLATNKSQSIFVADTIPEEASAVLVGLETMLRNLNSNIYRNAILHDYLNGIDEKVHILFDFFLSPSFRVRTGAVFVKPGTTLQDVRKWAHDLVSGCELDKLILIGDHAICDNSPNPCSHGIARISDITNLPKSIYPHVYIWNTRTLLSEIYFYSEDTKCVNPSNDSSIQFVNGTIMSIHRFMDQIIVQLNQRALNEMSKELTSDGCDAADSEYRFQSAVPDGTKFLAGTSKQEISFIQGQVKICGYLLPCITGGVIEQKGQRFLEFRSADGVSSKIRGAQLPAMEQLNIEGSQYDLPRRSKPYVNLRGEDFGNLFGEPATRPRGKTYRIAKAQSNGKDPWRLSVIGSYAFRKCGLKTCG